jgi:trigger factor
MYTVEKKEKNSYVIKMTVSPQEWEEFVNQAYESEKGKYNVEGFRKGKAPRKMIEQTYGENVFFDEAIDMAFVKEYAKALEEHKEIQPIEQPKLSLESFDEKGLVIVAEVDCVPEVVINKYKGIEVEKHDHPLDKDAVEKYLETQRNQKARFVVVEKPAKNTDTVTIDFVGSVDGEKFEGGAAEGHRLELGSKTFIGNFEEQIEGMQIGEKKDINVTFPKNYGVKELEGKPAVFEVTLLKVEEKQLPELNDTFASETSEFETLEELKASIQAKLEEENNHHLKVANENNLLETIVKNSEVDIPQVLIDRQLDMFIRDFELRLSYQGMKMEDYLEWSGATIEQLKEQQVEQAKSTVKTRLVIEKLIELENLYVTEKELDEKVAKLAARYKKDIQTYKKSLGEKQIQYFENELLMEKVFDFLTKENKFV